MLGVKKSDSGGGLFGYLVIVEKRVNVNAFDSAIQACEKAAQHSKSRDLAQRWISYISKEQEKYKAMRGES